LLDDTQLFASLIRGRRVLIATNETIAPLYLDRLRATLAQYEVDDIVLPDGESHKTLATAETVYTRLLEMKHNRATTLVALGGGVVGDTTGFVAATYQRGVDYIQVPTTLLAQVDSSVGGKTAVNHPQGKNMIGAFYQPRGVIIDTETLKTLPARELSAGLAEVIKHGALADRAYFDSVDRSLAALRAGESQALAAAIHRSCEIKAGVVAADEREQGERVLLNLGHTFGHAIETAMGYGTWLHGEAVGTGLVMAADLSMRCGHLSASDAKCVKDLVARAGLPIAPPPALGASEFHRLMLLDKKVSDDGLRLILMRDIGDAVVTAGVPDALLGETLAAGEGLCECG